MGEVKKPTVAANSSIYAKLLAFQKLGISIKKSESNPHFKSKYADITEVLEKIKPPLSELGVVLTQIPDANGLKTVIYDTDSDTFIESYLEYSQKGDPQKLGSNITYYRRYSLVAMLGLEDEDDDANKVKAPQTAAPATPPAAKMTLEQAFTKLRAATSTEQLKDAFVSLPKPIKNDPEVIALKDELKATLDF